MSLFIRFESFEGNIACILNSVCIIISFDHEIFSTTILSLPLIQEGQLSVSGERLCTIQVNRLEY